MGFSFYCRSLCRRFGSYVILCLYLLRELKNHLKVMMNGKVIRRVNPLRIRLGSEQLKREDRDFSSSQRSCGRLCKISIDFARWLRKSNIERREKQRGEEVCLKFDRKSAAAFSPSSSFHLEIFSHIFVKRFRMFLRR